MPAPRLSLRSRGRRASRPGRLRDTANVATSFPGFTRLAAEAGLGIAERSAA